MICRFSICSYIETYIYIYINLVNRWYEGNFSSLLKITRSTSRRSYFLHIIKIKIKLRIKASLRRKNAFPLQKYITNNNNNNRIEEHCAPIETSVATFYIFKLRLIERHSSLNKANYLSVSRGNSREYRSVNLFSFPVRGLIGRGMAKKKRKKIHKQRSRPSPTNDESSYSQIESRPVRGFFQLRETYASVRVYIMNGWSRKHVPIERIAGNNGQEWMKALHEVK